MRPENIFRRRMSPAPRLKAKALDIVGAAVTIVAAKMPSRLRRVSPVDAEVVILCPVPSESSVVPLRRSVMLFPFLGLRRRWGDTGRGSNMQTFFFV